MERKRHENLVTAVLTFCVIIFALLVVLTGFYAISSTWDDPAEESAEPVVSTPKGEEIIIKVVPPAGSPSVLLTGEEPEPKPVERYSNMILSVEEWRELAGIIQLEAGNQCTEGQQAVVEVVLNRVLSPEFPDTVHDVLHQGEDTKRPQFSTIDNLASAEPAAAQYEAIDAALYGPSILPEDVVFFSRNGENDRVWGKIQDHVFCYKYIWE